MRSQTPGRAPIAGGAAFFALVGTPHHPLGAATELTVTTALVPTTPPAPKGRTGALKPRERLADALQAAAAKYYASEQDPRVDRGLSASGLRWKNVGTEKPAGLEELSNEKLADALNRKTDFTQEEWNEFRVRNLRMSHVILSSDGFYFRPAAPQHGRYLGHVGGQAADVQAQALARHRRRVRLLQQVQ
uniref:Uncharacterized protein n=2 Tax=Prymnesium polylepis TaxID=72548 RepID=A0A7S4HDF0_9EUKA